MEKEITKETVKSYVEKISALREIEPEEPYIWADHLGLPVEWFLEAVDSLPKKSKS